MDFKPQAGTRVMFPMATYLANHIYKTGAAVDVVSGKWTVSNVYNEQPTLYIIIRNAGEIVADAHMDADTVDGLKNIEFADPQCGHRTRAKACELFRLWVEKNKAAVYPKR